MPGIRRRKLPGNLFQNPKTYNKIKIKRIKSKFLVYARVSKKMPGTFRDKLPGNLNPKT